MKTSKNTPTPVISCRNVAVGYKDHSVVMDINLSFEAGHFITLLGPNGAGKTTFLRTLSRHQAPLSGSIEIMGQPLGGFRQAELAKIMAVVLTDKITPPLFTVFQFAALGRYPHTGFLGRLTDHDKEVVDKSLAAVHAQELASRDFANLSDGERQKVLVARALAQEPQILLLDEPTAHLDLKHRMEVMAILRNLCRSKGITVIASLHDVDIAAKVSDRVALVKDGCVSHWGYPEEVLTSDVVAKLYDFDSACFSHHLGSIEVMGDGCLGRAFVVAGMGNGAAIYRLLAKRGYRISTGVLQSNDLDCFVAAGLGADYVSQLPADSISAKALQDAVKLLASSDLVIDAGSCENGVYQGNLLLIEQAVALGKPVFSLRRETTDRRIDKIADKIITVPSAGKLFDAMENST